VGRELRIHLVECVIGNAQCGQHLLANGLAPALFISLTQCDSAAQHGCEQNGSG
jgi:hypothetical protein